MSRGELLASFRDTIIGCTAAHTRVGCNIDGHSSHIGPAALSMAGQRRVDHVTALVASAVEDGV